MNSDNLTPKEAALLVLLLAENRDLTNTDLKEIYRFELNKQSREKLNRLGYVESTKDGRQPYVHQLTDAGWARCYEPLNLESPKARAQGAALAALMQSVLRHLEARDLSLADFAASSEASTGSNSDELGERIRLTYRRLAGRPGAFVGIRALRSELADLDRDTLDGALRLLERQGDVSVVPESNQKTLTAADREAALWIGGEHKHFLVIGV